jgi:condensin complex subunit 1
MSGNPTFPIPASLQELESAPYNLLPYPNDFDDDDEAARAESFHKLIRIIEAGNRSLISNGLGLFEVPDGEEDLDAWNDTERIQALYTLVRKSDSLAPATRSRLVKALCDAVHGLSEALANPGAVMTQTQQSNDGEEGGVGGANNNTFVVSQSFRDALACHIYMLFTVMFLTESKEKLGKSLNTGASSSSSSGRGGSKSKSKSSSKSKGQNSDVEDLAASRAACAEAMHHASMAMAEHKSRLWRRGVVDEAVVGLPCRIAYQMLESSTGVIARKASSGDAALQMIAATVDSAPCLLNTVVAALVDLLHTYDHIAPLVAELCCIVNENVLATELLREIGRLDTTDGSNDTGGKASGIKNIAPFISELAAVRPRVVLSNISLLLPHLDSEPYIMRSAIVNSIGHILVREDKTLMENKDDYEGSDEESKDDRHVVNMTKTRSSLFDILCDRTCDITSFTRAAALKVLNDLTEKQSLPLDRIMPVTAIAIDRLQDKAVMVRRYAMQVSQWCACHLLTRHVQSSNSLRVPTCISFSHLYSRTTLSWECSIQNLTVKRFVSSKHI